MAQPRTIALDAMGGDHGPEVVIPGAAISLVRHPALELSSSTATRRRIAPLLDAHPTLADAARASSTHRSSSP